MRYVKGLGHFRHFCIDPSRRDAALNERKCEVLPHAHVRGERKVLKDHRKIEIRRRQPCDVPRPGGPNRQNSSLSSTVRSTSSTATTGPKRLVTEINSNLATLGGPIPSDAVASPHRTARPLQVESMRSSARRFQPDTRFSPPP